MAQAAQAAQSGQPGEGPPGEGPPGQGPPGQGQGPPGQGQPGLAAQAAQAMAAAAQAMAAAAQAQMAQSRIPGQSPKSEGLQLNSGEGAAVQAGAMAFQDLPAMTEMSKLEWGRLPPKLAKDLMDGRREAVSGEYRNRVEAYFRAMADKSRKKK